MDAAGDDADRAGRVTGVVLGQAQTEPFQHRVPGHVLQLGVRLDLQPTDWLSIGLYYLPFFEPHFVHLYGTDYSFRNGAEVNEGLAKYQRFSAAERRAIDRENALRILPSLARG